MHRSMCCSRKSGAACSETWWKCSIDFSFSPTHVLFFCEYVWRKKYFHIFAVSHFHILTRSLFTVIPPTWRHGFMLSLLHLTNSIAYTSFIDVLRLAGAACYALGKTSSRQQKLNNNEPQSCYWASERSRFRIRPFSPVVCSSGVAGRRAHRYRPLCLKVAS